MEYKCGCVYSNNRWFPECPRHGEWWSAQAGTGDDFVRNKKHKAKGAMILYTNDTLDAISRVRDSSVGLILTYPMFQYEESEWLEYEDKYFEALNTKLKDDGTFILMTDASNIAPSILRLEGSGFKVKRFSQVLFSNDSDIVTPCVVLFANKDNAAIKCKYGVSDTPGKTLYFSDLAVTESHLVKNFCEEGGLVLDPFCTNAHTLDGTLHEGRRFIGFCEGAKQFETLKFYLNNFKADQECFTTAN